MALSTYRNTIHQGYSPWTAPGLREQVASRTAGKRELDVPPADVPDVGDPIDSAPEHPIDRIIFALECERVRKGLSRTGAPLKK